MQGTAPSTTPCTVRRRSAPGGPCFRGAAASCADHSRQRPSRSRADPKLTAAACLSGLPRTARRSRPSWLDGAMEARVVEGSPRFIRTAASGATWRSQSMDSTWPGPTVSSAHPLYRINDRLVMSLRNRKEAVMEKWKRGLSLVLFATFCILQGCAIAPPDGNVQPTREMAKKLLDREAQQSAVELLAVTYDPAHSRLINARQMREWLRKNRIDVQELPDRVRKSIEDDTSTGLLVQRFTPLDDRKAAARSYDIGGIFLPLFFEDLGGWWIGVGGGDCVTRCHKCRGCTGPGHICTCAFVCCTTCDRDECWRCQPCANNP